MHPRSLFNLVACSCFALMFFSACGSRVDSAEADLRVDSEEADHEDLCPDDPEKTQPGICGCGAFDVDGDGDGTPDCQDACPDDPGKVAPGNCGCGIPEDGCGKPIVRFVKPSTATVAANLGVVVEASASDGDIVEVNLFINDQFVRKEGGSPYEWGTANANQEDPSLLNLSQGSYELRAEAIDDGGEKGTATLFVTVSDTGVPGTYADGPGKIIYPWRATTAVLKAGQSFEVWFDAQADQTVNAVKLRGPFNELSTSIEVERGDWIYDKTSGNRYDTRITVSVPDGSPADRYDLILRTSIGDELSLGSVKVVKEYRKTYYVMHFSDTHTFQAGSDLSLYKVSTLAEIANILAPEMIFITGDQLYFPNDEKLDQFYNGIESNDVLGLHDFYAPTFVACGNHDWAQKGDSDSVAKAAHYNEYYGLHGYNFTYGDGRFMVINNGWSGNSHHTTDAISWLDDVGHGEFRLGAAHMANGGVSGLYKGADLDLILAGHNHYIADENPHPMDGDPMQYIASSIRDHAPEFNLFRVDIGSGTYSTVSGPTAQVVAIENPGDKDAPELYKPRLTLSFSKENDGTSSSNTAVIDNRFEFSLPEARIRFVMPLGYDYTASKGTIEQAFDGFFFRIVDVRLTVPADSTAEVSISGV